MERDSKNKADKEPRPRNERIKEVIKENLIIIMMVLAMIIGIAVGLGVRQLEGWEYYQKRKLFYLRFPGDLLMNMLKMLILPLIVSSIISSLASLNAKASALGLGVRQLEGWEYYQKRKLFYLRFPEDLLMNMLKMLILPLIVSSIISSLASLNAKTSGHIGLRAVVYYMTTTFSAVVLGIILVLLIRPGEKGDRPDETGESKKQEPLDALLDLIRNCFPDNIVMAAFKRQSTMVRPFKYNISNPHYIVNSTDNHTKDEFIEKETDEPYLTTPDGMNVLGIVVFSVFFGAILSTMGSAGRPLLDFFEAMHQATMKLTMLVIWYSPIGIIFLVSTKLIEMENPSSVFVQLGYYMITVLVGLAVHGFIVLPLVYFAATRKNPFIFMYNMLKALLTAWGTASSSATLPVTMECLEDRNKVDTRVAKFVVPIGATINMDGTALYEAVAAVFIAQVNGISLNVGEVITVSLTATAAAIGAAGIPSAGLITMTIVLTAVGLPVDDVTLILAIDWFLDRFRTAINVLGDSFGAGIVEHLSKGDLRELDHALDDCEVANGDIDHTITADTNEKQLNGLPNHGFSQEDHL